MAFEFDYNTPSPYEKRRNQVYGRPGGRPTGTTGGVAGQEAAGQPGQPQQTATPTGSGIQQELGQSPYAGFLKGLTQPVQYQDRYQSRYNIARGQIQGGTRTAMEQMKTYMGGRGFRGGESGFADTALGQIATGGAQRLSQAGLEIGESEAAQRQEYDRMNLQRMLGGGQLALTGEEGALNRMMDYYRTKLGAETAQFQPWWQGISQGYPTG